MTATVPELAQELATLEAQAATIAARITELRAAIAATAEVGTTIQVDDTPRWKVNAGRRTFSEARARETLPADLLAKVTVSKVDGTKLKKLDAEAWESCTTQGPSYLTGVAA